MLIGMAWLKIAILFHATAFANACNGFKFTLSNPKNCAGPDQIVKMVNLDFGINNKCEVVSSSCALIRPYKTATMVLKVNEDATTIFQYTYNLCTKKPKPEMVMTNIVGWGIPAFCPVTQEFKYCYNGTKVATVPSAAQRMLGIFSSSRIFSVKINITHDTGFSCFEADCSVQKKLAGKS